MRCIDDGSIIIFYSALSPLIRWRKRMIDVKCEIFLTKYPFFVPQQISARPYFWRDYWPLGTSIRPHPHGLKNGQPIICFKMVSFLSAFEGIWGLEICYRKGLPKETNYKKYIKMCTHQPVFFKKKMFYQCFLSRTFNVEGPKQRAAIRGVPLSCPVPLDFHPGGLKQLGWFISRSQPLLIWIGSLRWGKFTLVSGHFTERYPVKVYFNFYAMLTFFRTCSKNMIGHVYHRGSKNFFHFDKKGAYLSKSTII